MLKNKVLVMLLTLVIIVMSGCGVTSNGGGGSSTPAVNILSIGIDWAHINQATITGQDTTRVVPPGGYRVEGVFTKDRNITLSPYSLAKHELTYTQWKQVYDWAVSNNYTFRPGSSMGQIGSQDAGDPNAQPVTCVTWRDSVVWCNAYTEMAYGNDSQCVYRDSLGNVLRHSTHNIEVLVSTANMLGKKGYRLPTEAEWAYAARWQGTDSTNALDYGGVYLTAPDSFSGATQNCNYNDANNEVAWWDINSGGQTHDVGQKKSNALGIYDMSGNVWEWCFDYFIDRDYPTGNYTDPIMHSPALQDGRVIRGGSYEPPSENCVVSYCGDSVTTHQWGYWQSIKERLGFRVAYSR